MHILVGVVRETDAGQRGKRFCLGLAAGERPEAEGDVLLNGEMGEQREVLEHQPDAALLRRHEMVWSHHLLTVEQPAAGGRAAPHPRQS